MSGVNILSVPPSRLRAFAPLRKNREASHGRPASEFYTNLISLWGKGAKAGFVPGVLSAAQLCNPFLTKLSVPAFLFSHEGAKARRREGKTGFRSVTNLVIRNEGKTLIGGNR